MGTKSVRFSEQFQLEIAALESTCAFSAKRFRTALNLYSNKEICLNTLLSTPFEC